MPYPIILAHGIARFDEVLRPFGVKLYFRHAMSAIRDAGFVVRESDAEWAGSVADRAADLKRRVLEVLANTGDPKVHIIGHSMGGLDARWMIARLSMADSVASLTTIGTPHNGSSVADAVDANTSELVDALGRIGADLAGVRDLTTEACRQFNERAEPAEPQNDVRYVCYASYQRRSRVFGLLRPGWRILFETEGHNDGLVSVASQMWQPRLWADDGTRKTVERVAVPFEADHLNEIGWWDPSELLGSSWWNLWRRLRVGRFERRVRQLYIKMAQDAVAGECAAAFLRRPCPPRVRSDFVSVGLGNDSRI